MSGSDFELIEGDDARKSPVRVVVVQEDERPLVDLHEDDMVMAFPHLFVRELVTIVAASLLLVVISIIFDAPLEELANPLKTPNPAKAPWYFLGLQELLHYYPPLISGVVLPGLVVMALVIVPYVRINLERESFWETDRSRKLLAVGAAIVALSLLFFFTGAHPVWPIIIPTIALGALMMLPGIRGTSTPLLSWLGTRSLAFWIFSWFLILSIVLTIIGTFFRGPGWEFTLPWRDGVY